MTSAPISQQPPAGQASLHYQFVNVQGDLAVRYDHWFQIAAQQGIEQTGYYAFDRKKKTLEILNLRLTGEADLISAVAAAISRVTPQKA